MSGTDDGAFWRSRARYIADNERDWAERELGSDGGALAIELIRALEREWAIRGWPLRDAQDATARPEFALLQENPSEYWRLSARWNCDNDRAFAERCLRDGGNLAFVEALEREWKRRQWPLPDRGDDQCPNAACDEVTSNCTNCDEAGCPSCDALGRCRGCTDPVLPWRRDLPEDIAQWESQPLDPQDDLSIISAYPAELVRRREFQAEVRADPIYQVVNRIGGQVRAEFIQKTVTDLEYDEGAAGVFYVERVCRCARPPVSAHALVSTIGRWRNEFRCPPCLILDGLMGKAVTVQAVEARQRYDRSMRAALAVSDPQRASAQRLTDILRADPW